MCGWKGGGMWVEGGGCVGGRGRVCGWKERCGCKGGGMWVEGGGCVGRRERVCGWKGEGVWVEGEDVWVER